MVWMSIGLSKKAKGHVLGIEIDLGKRVDVLDSMVEQFLEIVRCQHLCFGVEIDFNKY